MSAEETRVETAPGLDGNMPNQPELPDIWMQRAAVYGKIVTIREARSWREKTYQSYIDNSGWAGVPATFLFMTGVLHRGLQQLAKKEEEAWAEMPPPNGEV